MLTKREYKQVETSIRAMGGHNASDGTRLVPLGNVLAVIKTFSQEDEIKPVAPKLPPRPDQFNKKT